MTPGQQIIFTSTMGVIKSGSYIKCDVIDGWPCNLHWLCTWSFSDSDEEPCDAVDSDVGEDGGGVPDGRQTSPFVWTVRLKKVVKTFLKKLLKNQRTTVSTWVPVFISWKFLIVKIYLS